MTNFFDKFNELLRQTFTASNAGDGVPAVWLAAAGRYVLAFLAIVVVVRIAISLFRGKKEPETWGYLNLRNGLHIPIIHWENTIGRARSSDIVLNFGTVSRNHAALMRTEDGRWRFIDIGSKTGISVNGSRVNNETTVDYGDVLNIGGVDVELVALSSVERTAEENREIPGKEIKPAVTLYLLTLFQLVLCLQLCFAAAGEVTAALPLSFLFLSALMWMYFVFFRVMRKRGFEVETVAFFLSSVGLGVTASSMPRDMYKQVVAVVVGLALFVLLGWFLRDLKRADKMRWPMGAAAVGLLMITIVFGSVVYGAKNWIFIAGFSIQPSEMAKLCFIYAGTATLDRLFAKRNLVMYIALAASCAAALAYMSDFGAALIFFAAFLVVAFMRSGDVATLSLICVAVGLGGFLALRFRPYIAYRFASWRHAWQVPHDGGFQQTRTMSAAASGGFFGIGAGRGWLKNIPAADTDLVFGMVCEELGLIVGLCCIAGIVILAFFAAGCSRTGRSTFYGIAAAAATSMMVFQMMLNVFGSVDILPLTGVTFPFVSKGGSSLVSCFGMLAFIKAADTRRNASFAIKNESIFARSKVK